MRMRKYKFSDYKWEKNFAAAKRYYEENGNLACKSSYVTPDGIKLGFWLSNIRAAASGSSRIILTDERKAQLDSIGMVWDKRNYAWEERFSEAQSYYLEHKNLNVPSGFVTENGFHLGVWISNIRKSYFRNELSAEKIQRFESIGMVWLNRFDIRWLDFYEDAKAFYEEHGHLEIQSGYTTDEKSRLGRWIISQRNAHQEGKLDSERISLLNQIGINWEKNNL